MANGLISSGVAAVRRNISQARAEIVETPVVGRFSATILTVFFFGIGYLAWRVSPGTIVSDCARGAPDSAFGIPDSVGFLALTVTSVVLLLSGWAPIINRVWPELQRAGQPITRILIPFAWLWSAMDVLLARGLAVFAGVKARRLRTRYAVMLSHLVGAAAIAGFADETWYGIGHGWGVGAAAWGVLITIAVARRWAWVESDREKFQSSGNEDSKKYRVGFDQDLRDEALSAFVLLFLIVPLGIRQLDFLVPGHLFTAGDGNASALDWVGMFGAELAKTLPFVDWAEVYGVQNLTRLCPANANGAHIVFGLRAGLDLFMLASLLQALQISARITSQRNAFFTDNSIDKLDPFEERHELISLFYRAGRAPALLGHEVIRRFPNYAPSRLKVVLNASSSTPSQRCVAAALLHKQERRNATQSLVANLGDQNFDVVITCITALTRLPDGDAADGLIALLRHENWRCRAAAIEALKALRAPETGPALLECAINSLESMENRRAALDAVGHTGAGNQTGLLIRMVSGRSQLAPEACLALGRMKAANAAEVLIAALVEDDGVLRRAATEALGLLGDPTVVDRLLEELRSDDDETQVAAALALGRIGDDRAIDPLLVALQEADNDNNTLQAALADAIGRLGAGDGLEILITLMSDEDESLEVRLAAAKALGRLDQSSAVEPLLALLVDESVDPELRAECAKSLGRLPATHAVSDMSRLVRDARSDVAIQCAIALGNIGDASALSALRSVAQDDRMGIVGLAALVSFARLNKQRHTAILAVAIAGEIDTTASYAFALGLSEDVSATQPLSALLEADEWDVRACALIALARVGDRSEALRLINDLLDSDLEGDPDVIEVARAARAVLSHQDEEDIVIAARSIYPFIRAFAAWALGEVRWNEDPNLWEDLLADEDQDEASSFETVRDAAMQAKKRRDRNPEDFYLA